MPYVTSIERVLEWRGLRDGIEAVLRVRFGPEGLKLMPEINEIYDEKQLRSVLRALETAPSPEDVRRLWTEKLD